MAMASMCLITSRQNLMNPDDFRRQDDYHDHDAYRETETFRDDDSLTAEENDEQQRQHFGAHYAVSFARAASHSMTTSAPEPELGSRSLSAPSGRRRLQTYTNQDDLINGDDTELDDEVASFFSGRDRTPYNWAPTYNQASSAMHGQPFARRNRNQSITQTGMSAFRPYDNRGTFPGLSFQNNFSVSASNFGGASDFTYNEEDAAMPPPPLRTGPSLTKPFIEHFFPKGEASMAKKTIAAPMHTDGINDEVCAMPELTRYNSLFDPKDDFKSDENNLCRDFDWQEEEERLSSSKLKLDAMLSNPGGGGRESNKISKALSPTKIETAPKKKFSLADILAANERSIAKASGNEDSDSDIVETPVPRESISKEDELPVGKSSEDTIEGKASKSPSPLLGEHSSAIIDAALSNKEKDIIINPTSSDILLGRGNLANYHEGNKQFRGIVKKYKGDYAKVPTGRKMQLANVVLAEVAKLDPPGRFLTQDPTTLLWHEVTKKRAMLKVRQALRERDFFPRSKEAVAHAKEEKNP